MVMDGNMFPLFGREVGVTATGDDRDLLPAEGQRS